MKTLLICPKCGDRAVVVNTYSSNKPREGHQVPVGEIHRVRKCVGCKARHLTEEKVVYSYE